MKILTSIFFPTKGRWWLALLIGGAAFALAVQAAELQVGDAVPAFTAKDQFGQEFKFAAGLRFLLLGFDMGASRQANLKLADLGAGWLEKRQAAYVLDIHAMPAVARAFAVPKMRRYPHRIVLVDDEDLLARFPRQAGRVTVLVLAAGGKVQAIRYWNPATEPLDASLK